jgi:pyridoxal 5'-phosphate synthase pdxT subunit
VSVIGVLALQGDFHAHGEALAQAGVDSVEVRRPADLDRAGGLILPGGESTTLVKLIREMGLEEPLRAFAARGRPVLGTCAGAILLAARVEQSPQFCFGLIDIDVRRNAYGRQRDSFESGQGLLRGPEGEVPVEMVFIRAPRISRVGPGVEVMGRHAGEPVLVRQGNILAATFHPEMGEDRTVHRLLARLSEEAPAAVRVS